MRVATASLRGAAFACAGALAAQTAQLQSVEPRALSVGDALTLAIRVEHAPDESVELLGLDDALGVRWAELAQSIHRSAAQPQALDRRATDIELVITPLESGGFELPRLYVQLAGGADPFSLPVASAGEPARVEVSTALAEGEDAPRELRPLRDDAFAGDVAFSGVPLALGAVAALVGGGLLVFFVQRARRRERIVAALPGVFERLALLEAELARPESASVRDGAALAHALAALARDAVSELCPALRVARGSASRAALTDEEFVAALDAGAPERERLCGLFLRLQAARWAGETGSTWARDAWIAETRECLEALRARGLRGEVLAERAEAVA